MPGNDDNGESSAYDDIEDDIEDDTVIDIEGPIFPVSEPEYYSPDLDGPFFPPPAPPIPPLAAR